MQLPVYQKLLPTPLHISLYIVFQSQLKRTKAEYYMIHPSGHTSLYIRISIICTACARTFTELLVNIEAIIVSKLCIIPTYIASYKTICQYANTAVCTSCKDLLDSPEAEPSDR